MTLIFENLTLSLFVSLLSFANEILPVTFLSSCLFLFFFPICLSICLLAYLSLTLSGFLSVHLSLFISLIILLNPSISPTLLSSHPFCWIGSIHIFISKVPKSLSIFKNYPSKHKRYILCKFLYAPFWARPVLEEKKYLSWILRWIVAHAKCISFTFSRSFFYSFFLVYTYGLHNKNNFLNFHVSREI